MTIVEIEKRVIELLKEEVPSVDFSRSDRMADDGYIDSLSMSKIITAVSLEFGVTIAYEDIVPENFNSPRTIAQMIVESL